MTTSRTNSEQRPAIHSITAPRLLFLFLQAAFLWFGTALPLYAVDKAGQKKGDEKPAEEKTDSVEPPSEENVANILLPEMREVLTQIVQTLRQKADTDLDFFFVPPERTRTVVDHREVAVRYKKVTVERPVYEKKYDTETYEIVVNRGGVSNQSTGKMEKVTRKRRKLVSKKKVGTKTVTRLVRDKNGSIVKTHRRPVYGPGGADIHYPGFFAQNSMALYLSAKAGVPHDDDLMSATSQNIANLAMAYGLPDRTWDLAWTTAAMVNMPKDDDAFRKVSERLVHKLLLGQFRDGDAEGMWGPVCVDPFALSAMIEFEQKYYDKHIKKWEAKLKDNPDREYYQEKLSEVQETLKVFRRQHLRVAQLGLAFRRAQYRRNSIKPKNDHIFNLQTGTGMDDGRPAKVEGLPYNIYGERLADIESTSLVLFALREASENGYLPEQTWVPKKPDGEPLVSSRQTSKILRSSFKALTERVQRNGMANEANQWSAIHVFDDIPGLGLPYDDDRIERLESGITFTTTARASAALMDAAAMLNDTRGLDLNTYNATLRMHETMIEAFLKNNLRGLKVGGHSSPYEFIFHSARASMNPLDLVPEERKLWAWLAEYVLENKKSAEDEEQVFWLKKGERLLPTSVKPYLRKDFTAKIEGNPAELTKKQTRKLNRRVGHWRGRLARQLQNEVVATTYAGLHLLSGLRPNVVGMWAWNAKPPRTSTIRPVLARITKEKEQELSHGAINPSFPSNAATGTPMVMMSGTGAFQPKSPDSVERLSAYLAAGGVLVVEAPANKEGIGFLKSVQAEITKHLDGTKATRLPPLTDDLPKVIAVRSAAGRPVAVFLPIAGTASEKREVVFTRNQAMRFLYELLLRILPDDYFDDQYAIDYQGILDYEEEMRQKREEESRKEAEEEG